MSRTARQELDRSVSEDDLLTAVTEALELFNWVWQHPRRSDKALVMGDQGIPDIIAVRNGRVLFLELKRQGENLETAQWAWFNNFPPNTWAFTALVVRPSDLDELLEKLR